MTSRKLPGTAKKAEGSLTEAFGKLTGDKEIEVKGAAKKLEGEAEHAAALAQALAKKPARSPD